MRFVALAAPLALIAMVTCARADTMPPPGAEMPITVMIEQLGGEPAAGGPAADPAPAEKPGTVHRVVVKVHNATVMPMTGVTLVLSAENAEIIASGQRGVSDGVARIVMAPLPAGATQSVEAAVMLGGATGEAVTTARFWARAEADLWVSWNSIAWTVSDCASAFHAALGELHRHLPELDRAVDLARTADKSLPGRFLFKPASGADKETASALRIAGTIASRRGADAFFSSRDVRWYLGQIYRDLNDYTGQPANPMICSGARDVAAFLGKYAERVTKYADNLDAEAERLRHVAEAAIAAAWGGIGASGSAPQLAGPAAIDGIIDRLITAAGGPAVAAPDVPLAPGTSVPADLGPKSETAAPVSAMAGMDGMDGMAAMAAAIVAADHPLPRPNPEPQPFEVFVKARAVVGDAGAIASEDARRALAAALGAIESYYYISLGAGRADAVRDGLAGNLEGIVEAHDRLCTCE